MECMACGGKDEHCKVCDGWGYERIVGCPRELIPQQVWRLVEYADLTEKGSWPVSGGFLEQSDSFVSGCRAVSREVSYWKAKNGIK